ncbi:MAG: hydroxyacylglutathione hydrolase [Myxococcota bacterium]
MSHVVRVAPEPIVRGELEIHAVPAATDNLVWLVVCRRTGEAAVVDGPSCAEVLAYAGARGISVGAVWNTHTHGDHVGINRDLLARGELPPRVYGGVPEVPGITDLVGEGSTVRLGALTAAVWRTEGHLHGHVSFVLPGAVFCGDTLFAGGCGRVLGGTHQQLFESLMRLAELPGDTLVCCAHEYTRDNLRFAWSVEPDNQALATRIARVWSLLDQGRTAVPSTIDDERATNPFLRPGSPTLVSAVDPAARATPLGVFTALRTLKDHGAYRALPDPRAA